MKTDCRKVRSSRYPSSRGLSFRRGRSLLLRFGFGLGCFPPDRRGFRRRFLAIQISDATPTFDPDPMLLTHDAFYRTEGRAGATRNTPQPPENQLLLANRIAMHASGE